MANTTASKVIDSFESSFADKRIVPRDLEIEWLQKAAARYSVEIESISFDGNTEEFDKELDRYSIDILAAYMKQSYQEREVSKVDKRVSIVGKDLSIDGLGNSVKYNHEELSYDNAKSQHMTHNMRPTAYV